MPQLVRDFLYWSQMEQGVEMSVSMSLAPVSARCQEPTMKAKRLTNGPP